MYLVIYTIVQLYPTIISIFIGIMRNVMFYDLNIKKKILV